MNKIVDSPNERETGQRPEDKPEYSLDDLAIEETPETSTNEPTESDGAGLPDKYKGKSVADVAKMHQELEQRFGQQGNEVGELRRTLDQFILNRLQDGTQTKPPTAEKIDVFEDPEGAVESAIKNSPELQSIKQATERAERVALQNELRTLHPSYQEFLKDGEFLQWIEGSKLRQRLLVQADKDYDLEAADELFTEWEGIQAAKRQASKDVVDSEQEDRKQQIKKASTGNARGNPSGRSSKKIFRRADIVELIKTDPKRYEALAPEIRRAYAEGRVR